MKNIVPENINKIEIYNKKVFSGNLKHSTFKKDKKIWVPYYLGKFEFTETNSIKLEPPTETKKDIKKESKKKSVVLEKTTQKEKSEKNKLKLSKFDLNIGKNTYPIFGKKYAKVKIKDTKLKGRVYYIDPGHGGPDPGAIGKRNGHELHEDEYAYDVSLRLARCLVEHGAKVYVMIVDDNDGIRNEEYLKPSYDEHYLGGDSISPNQKERLSKRAELINKLYKQNKNSKSQNSITIHLDSRVTKQRIDIFFYYKEGSDAGKTLAETLFSTIKEKYQQVQPGRGYSGSISTRSLFLLRELLPTATYIELGNIQNKNDQYRFIQAENRQTIAKWLCDGLIKSAKVK